MNYDIEILVVGDACIGKTCMIKKLCKKSYEIIYNPTLCIEYYSTKINKLNVDLKILDIFGVDLFRSYVKSYFNLVSCIIICYDSSSKKSFESLKYWIEYVNKYVINKVKIIAIGTKTDLIKENTEIDNYLKTLNIPQYFTSIYDATQYEIFENITKNIYDDYKNGLISEGIYLNETLKDGHIDGGENTNCKICTIL